MKLLCIIVGILLLAALFWEYMDYKRVAKLTSIYNLPTGKERVAQMKFISCFSYENTVRWRSLFIAAIIITVCIGCLIPMLLPDVIDKDKKIPFLVLTFFFIFLVSYFTANFRSFHLDRVLCSKVKKDTVVL